MAKTKTTVKENITHLRNCRLFIKTRISGIQEEEAGEVKDLGAKL